MHLYPKCIQTPTFVQVFQSHVLIQRGTGGPYPPPPPLLKITKIGFLSNTGFGSPENRKATKPEFNVGPLLARKINTI